MRLKGNPPFAIAAIRGRTIENIGCVAATGLVEPDRHQMPCIEFALRVPHGPLAGDRYDSESIEKTLGTSATVAVVDPVEANTKVAEQFRFCCDVCQLAQAGELPAVHRNRESRAPEERHGRLMNRVRAADIAEIHQPGRNDSSPEAIGQERQGRGQVASLGALNDFLSQHLAHVRRDHNQRKVKPLEQTRYAAALLMLPAVLRIDIVPADEQTCVDLPCGLQVLCGIDTVQSAREAQQPARGRRRLIVDNIDVNGDPVITMRPPVGAGLLIKIDRMPQGTRDPSAHPEQGLALHRKGHGGEQHCLRDSYLARLNGPLNREVDLNSLIVNRRRESHAGRLFTPDNLRIYIN